MLSSSDEEPLFHYSRLAPKLQSMLSPGATLTCAVVHPRYIVRRRRFFFAAAPAFVLSGWHAQDW